MSKTGPITSNNEIIAQIFRNNPKQVILITSVLKM